MEPTLALVACGPQLEVGLWAEHLHAPSVVRLAGPTPRSALLLSAVDLLVTDAGLAPEDVAHVVVGRGPGSFTGIRSALATAEGLRAANGASVSAYGSLEMQASRCRGAGEVWSAQPGRRGEVYARRFDVVGDSAPRPLGEIEIIAVGDLTGRGPWVAAESLDLGAARREPAVVTAAEALVRMVAWGVPSEAVEPMYVEGPPIHRPGGSRA